jgi:hypothetical protein
MVKMQTIILLLALRGTTDFNKMDLNCKNITATWSSTTQHGIRTANTEYVSIFDTYEALEAELHKHCSKYF